MAEYRPPVEVKVNRRVTAPPCDDTRCAMEFKEIKDKLQQLSKSMAEMQVVLDNTIHDLQRNQQALEVHEADGSRWQHDLTERLDKLFALQQTTATAITERMITTSAQWQSTVRLLGFIAISLFIIIAILKGADITGLLSVMSTLITGIPINESILQ